MRPGTDRRGDATAYCPDCGARVAAEANYCRSCGAEQDAGPRNRSAASARAGRRDHEYDEFRRRVRDWVADGWEIEYDAGDEVMLVDRGVGSIPLHVLLFFTTSGVGNLLYGWYKYSKDADRVLLRAGDDAPLTGDERASADASGIDSDRSESTGRYVAGIALLGTAALVLAAGALEPTMLVVGLTLLFAAIYVFPPTRRRLRDRHPVTAFGPTQSVDERVVADTEKPCSICRSRIDRGIVREYKNEYAAAGVPLYTIDKGENWYCQECASGAHEPDYHRQSEQEDDDGDERTRSETVEEEIYE